MKKILIFLLFEVLCLGGTVAQQPHWNNLNVYRTGALLPHDRIVPDGDWHRSLNGRWLFRHYDTPGKATLHPDRWDSILVPGNIELQGYGVPVYVNMKNEFPSNPPYAPTDYNPTGVYMRRFGIPAHWQGRRTIVKFGAVSSAMYLYVNGHEVGYSEDSKTPHEWDITRYLHAGVNEMAVKVLRWCDGSYLECQDMWRLSGITRDVELYSVPRVYVSDLKVTADLDTTDYSTGRLEVLVDLSERVEGGAVEVEVCGVRQRKALSPREWFVALTPEVGQVEAWTDSTPTLYPMTVRYYDAQGRMVEQISKRIGFRHIDIRQGQLRLNGRAMEIRGVNRHEHSMHGGHYVTPAEMRRDVALMKELGINAVRTSHYPDDELWYDLCDSAGIYLWDEANLESHAQGYGDAALPKHKEWMDPMLDRVYSMYRRDRNHPSVIAWSLGNECGNGICMEEAYRKLKEYDPTRPVVYERAELDANTDIVAVMYPSVDFLSDYARDPRQTRPYIIAEYCHAMGNSMGGLKDYWDTIDKYPQLQGGFIWDWVDQAFRVENGRLTVDGSRWRDERDSTGRWWAAGGDLGELPGLKDDDAFCANGILAADRSPHPHAAEVEAVYTRGRHSLVLPDQSGVDSLTRSGLRRVRARIGKNAVTLQNGHFRLDIDPHTGHIMHYIVGGQELLASPMRPNFWRPPTENDLVDPQGARAWQGLDKLQSEVLSVQADDHRVDGQAEVQMLLHLTAPDGLRIRMKQIVEADADGRVQLSFMVTPDGQFRTLPKLGIQWGVDTTWDGCSFYGNVFETYPDRREARRIGRWYKPTDELAAPQYVVPEEQGNREARWVTLHSSSRRLTVAAPDDQDMLNFSVRRHNDTTLTAARRWRGLTPDNYYTISADYRVAPLGTATCGPGVADRYVISGDSTYTYRFLLSPTNVEILRAARFAPHPDLQQLPPEETGLHAVVTHITSSAEPASQYSKGFPSVITDCRHAVAGDYQHGWAGFSGRDTLTLTLSLKQSTQLGEVSASACHSPTDWVMSPLDVLVQWSEDSLKWSDWQSLALSNPPQNIYTDSRRLRYVWSPRKTIKVRYVRLRYVCRPSLPPWHPYAGEPAWLMIDEVEVKSK